MPRLSNAQLWDRLNALGKATGPRPPEPRRNKRRSEESKMQRALVRWFDLNAKAKFGVNPLVLWAVPNAGVRGVVTAAIMKAEGMRPGVPDLVLAKPMSKWIGEHQAIWVHGLFLELKTPEGRISPEQETYHEVLRGQGYAVNVIRSFDEGVEVITKYLS
jgi:hypothetical protein